MSSSHRKIQQLLRERHRILVQLLNKEEQIRTLQVEDSIDDTLVFTYYRPTSLSLNNIKSVLTDGVALRPIEIDRRLRETGHTTIQLTDIRLALFHGVLNGDFVTDGCGNYKILDEF